MKLKKFGKSIVILTITIIALVCSSALVYAEPVDGVDPEIDFSQSETDVPIEDPDQGDDQNWDEPDVSEEETVATQATEPETTAPPTTNQPEETEAETYIEETQPDVTYEETQPVTYTLPFANVIEEATAPLVDDEEREPGDFTYGIASWICVIAGIIVIMVVLISNKTQYHTGGGKYRYDEGDRITGQKRLLNDDYYNRRNAQSYYKGTRR